MKNYRNVCEVIVKNDFCIGCGICASVCPVQVLEMRFNKFGEYQPVEYKDGCLPNCDICLRACPFWNQDQNEDTLTKDLFSSESSINHTKETGYYLESYVGYSELDQQRIRGASGGLATWLLETLFEQKLVDKAISVVPNSDPEKLFKFAVHNSVEEIMNSSKSAYYPVELSEVLNYIKENDGKYVITALPCFSKGLRLATKVNKKIKERIKFIVGLVCGQSQSKYFAEYLCMLKGGNPKEMKKALFRVKDLNRPASDFGFQFKCASGDVKNGEIYWKEGMGEVWHDGYFTPNACYYCDDIFAETADVVFMDAWLPEYSSDPNGTNLVLTRNSQINQLFFQGKETGNIQLKSIDINKIITSQAGVVFKKRNELTERIKVQTNEKGYFPKKRFTHDYSISFARKINMILNKRIRSIGRQKFDFDELRNFSCYQIKVYKLLFKAIARLSYYFSKFNRKLETTLGGLWQKKK